jgi:hypothetical protein
MGCCTDCFKSPARKAKYGAFSKNFSYKKAVEEIKYGKSGRQQNNPE